MKNFLRIIGMLTGAAMIIFGIVTLTDVAFGGYTWGADYASFGADFYTYIYEATRAAAENTESIENTLSSFAEAVMTAVGVTFIFAGLTEVCYFGSKIDKKKSEVIPFAQTTFPNTYCPSAQTEYIPNTNEFTEEKVTTNVTESTTEMI